jgi:hypothetical protein
MDTIDNIDTDTDTDIYIDTDKNLYSKYKTIIYNYFIDNDIDNYIKIKKNDTVKNKIKYFLLKYKRIIGLVLLIILLIIGYFCNPYNIDTNDNNFFSDNNTQTGGALSAVLSAGPSVAGAAGSAGAAEAPKGFIAKQGAKYDKRQKDKKEWQDKKISQLKSGAKAAVSPSTYYDAGAVAARAIKQNADFIYQIFYAIAMFIIICIVTLPAIGFFIVGIFCYFLLKNKIKTFKGL